MSIATSGSRRRRTAAGALALAAGIGVVGVGTAAPASAAGPVTLQYAGQNTNFPTWVFGFTTVCATNTSAVSNGRAVVRPFGAWYGTSLQLAPSQTRCMSGAWGGFPVNVANAGPTAIRVYSL